MRCYICDHQLTDKEVNYNQDLGMDEPCTTCLDVALDAAYSGGFSPFGEEVTKVGIDAEWDSADGFASELPLNSVDLGFRLGEIE